MANVIKIKAGNGVPTTSNIVDRELAFNRSNNKLYINDSGTIVDLSGTAGGGAADEADRIVFDAQAGEALSKGDVVYISGISGNTPIVSKADADDANKMPSFGLAATSASLNTSVQIVTFGTLENFDTSAFSVGDTVFVSTTAGGLTATKPTGESGLIQNMGHIVRSHASTGAIKIVGAGRTAATPNLNEDKIFLGNASNQAVSTALSSIGLSKFNNDLGFGGGANRLITDDGDGTVSTEANLTFDASSNLDLLSDSGKLRIGTSQDLEIYHDGSNNYIDSTTSDQDLYIRGNDGGSMITAARFDMSDAGTLLPNNNLRMGDNQKIRLGTSNDFNLYHDGSDSYIYNDTGGGRIIIQNTTSDGDIEIKVNDSDGNAATNAIIIDTSEVAQIVLPNDNQRLTIGASRDLQFYHSGNINYIRTITQDQDLHFNVNDGGSTITALQIDASEVGRIILPNDNQALYFGTAGDLRIQHNGTDSLIRNHAGALKIEDYSGDGDFYLTQYADNRDIILQTDDGSGGVTPYITLDGSAERIQFSKKAYILDNVKFEFGDGADLQIYHDGSNSSLQNNTGVFYINQTASASMSLQTNNIQALEITSAQVLVPRQDVKMQAGKKLYLDGGTHTYIDEPSGDQLRLVAGGTEVLKGYSGGAIDMYGGSINRSINIGANRTADAASFIDLVGDTTYTDYGARLIRNSGANAITDLSHRGTGALRLRCQDAGAVLFMISDAEKMRVASSGNVGIGVTSPGEKLDLRGGNFRVGGFNTGSDYGAIFTPADSASYWHIYNDAGGHLAFGRSATIGSSEKMRISSAGNVGIGTTSPEQKLHIEGNICRLDKVGNDGGYYLYDSSNNFRFALFDNNSVTQIYADGNGSTPAMTFNGGNVGIGTTSPGYKLDVVGTIRTTGEIYLDNGGDAIAFMGVSDAFYRKALYANNDDHYVTNRHTGGDLILMSNNGSGGGETERLRFVAGSGTQNAYFSNVNLGIGTTSPLGHLDINTESAEATQVYINGEASQDKLLLIRHYGNSEAAGALQYAGFIGSVLDNVLTLGHYDNSGNETQVLHITEGANVGIGTASPSVKLHVVGQTQSSNGYLTDNGTTSAFMTPDANNLNLGTITSGKGVGIFTANSEKVRIDSSGNVGIGTASPLASLHLGASTGERMYVYANSTVRAGFGVDLSGSSRELSIFHSSSNASDGNISFGHRLESNGSYAERMRITGAGRVLIGGTSPSGHNYDLEVLNNNAYVQGPDGWNGTGDLAIVALGSSHVNEVFGCGYKYGTGMIMSIYKSGGYGSFGSSSYDAMTILDTSGNVGIGTGTPYDKLDVKSASSTSPAIVANGAAANGCVNMAHGYAGQNGDYVCTYGTQYSSIAMVLGYGVKPSTTANDTFIASCDNANFTRGALVIDDELRFWQAGAQTGTLNNNISMTERFRLTALGAGHFDSDVVAYSSTVSDKRLKENITTIDNALDKVMALRGVEYDWTATSRKGTHDIGLVAQEVEEVIPELVTEHELCTGEFGGEGNEKTFKTVNYDKMVGVLIEAIKEQQQQINELKEKLNG